MTNSPESTGSADDHAAEITGNTETTPTTAEEAMDAESDDEGFVDESSYAPTSP